MISMGKMLSLKGIKEKREILQNLFGYIFLEKKNLDY